MRKLILFLLLAAAAYGAWFHETRWPVRGAGDPLQPLVVAQGALTGKYLNGARPAGARFSLYDRFKRYTSKRAETGIAAYVALARQRGIDPGQMAPAFAASQPFMTSLIIGATSVAQLDHDVASLDLKIDAELCAAIDTLHAEAPNPCP